MKGHGAKFETKMYAAVAALLSQRNHDDAAQAAGISTATLLRWQKLPAFQIAMRDARRAAYSQAIGRLQYASSAAVSTLIKAMVDPHTPASTRVRAADSVLSHSAKAIEIDDIETRLALLESESGSEER